MTIHKQQQRTTDSTYPVETSMNMQPRSLPMCRYTSTRCYTVNSYIQISVHLLLRHIYMVKSRTIKWTGNDMKQVDLSLTLSVVVRSLSYIYSLFFRSSTLTLPTQNDISRFPVEPKNRTVSFPSCCTRSPSEELEQRVSIYSNIPLTPSF